ncbi:uncharacterized protein LOC143373331 isoform X2 [Andrena cerasifolii]|uniref:uncharacterized protein LOC143373331 isoform X2 n=1 Tax=Andrena cerasifolii TaxID=2819439 RepID=UPI004037D494
MMLCGKVVTVCSLSFLAIASGMPQGNDNKDASVGLPFLQFTNGGIRFNFGGYHAEAGLGGLLSGSNTGGGLHASAGTPWGANAAAGLGGLLSGDNANTGGGLYARAGLGNGRPEAAAGLGGRLDGSGRSNVPAAGGLFAGATTGARSVGVVSGATSGGPAAETDAQAGAGGNAEGTASKGRANIQIISRGGKKSEKIKQVSKEVIAVQQDQPATKEVREAESYQAPIASAGLFGTVSVNPAPMALPSIDALKIIGDIGTIEPAPPVPPLPSQVNDIVQVEKRPARVRVVYPKWVVRKRLWAPRKQIIYNTSVEVQDPSNANAGKLSRRRRQAEPASEPAPRANTVPNGNHNNPSYDDIFKILIHLIVPVYRYL